MSRTSSARAQTRPEVEAFSYSLPDDLAQAVKQAQKSWDGAAGTDRLWKKDAALWTNAGESKWLGWLEIIDLQLASVSKFKALAAEIAEDAFTHLVLLGMGGSSLCPEVFSATFGKQPNAPELLVLDSTDPVQIKRLRAKIDPARTLFCVSSKSGATLEPRIYLQYFFEETKNLVGDRAGHHFIAITDPGSALERVAAELGFRQLFYGDPSIGGCYSAFSDFGLAPHAGMGLDTVKFLKHVVPMAHACKNPNSARNPGVELGLILGTAAKFGHDKITLICSESIYGVGAWLEQLLAESTGKEGRGLIPVDREPVVNPRHYGNDRVFAYLSFTADCDAKLETAVASLERAGAPVIRIALTDLYDLGRIFFQWEIAAAVAGSLIGINSFDQPDVEASKEVTRELTAEFEETGLLPAEIPILEQDGIKLFTDQPNAETLLNCHPTLGGVIRRHLDRIRTGDYFGLLAYIPMFPEHEAKLQEIRREILNAKRVATVLGFGPRFLHSTGQAYKGGPNSGVFLQITCEDAEDLPVPGQKYTFGLVKAAQARGDFQVLADRKRRVLRAHVGKDVAADLERLRDLVCAAVAH